MCWRRQASPGRLGTAVVVGVSQDGIVCDLDPVVLKLNFFFPTLSLSSAPEFRPLDKKKRKKM